MPRGRKEDVAVVSSTGVLNTDTASCVATFPVGPLPSSVERGSIPKISGVSIRSLVPELPEHIQTKLQASQQQQKAHNNNDMGSMMMNNEDGAEVTSSSSSSLQQASDAVVTVSFDMDPVAAPIANLLRRLIVTEVPTMAFDRVLIDENDTPVFDEMLCQRLGMTPIQVDASFFEYVTSENTPGNGTASGNTIYSSAKHVLRFDMDVSVPLDAPLHTVHCVYASQLKWVPLPGQENLNVRIVHPELLLAKIGCGQRLKLQAFALKGIGLTHAKWSPVSACYYEMRTQVRLLQPVIGEHAEQLVKLAPKVFGLQRGGNDDDSNSVQAVVLKEVAFQDCSRLYQDGIDFSDYVSIEKVKDSVRFTYETLGQFENPIAIVSDSLRTFAERLRYLKTRIERTNPGNASKFETAAQSADI